MTGELFFLISLAIYSCIMLFDHFNQKRKEKQKRKRSLDLGEELLPFKKNKPTLKP